MRSLIQSLRHRITTRILAYLLILSLLPLAVNLWLDFRLSSVTTRAEMLRHLATIADSKTRSIDAYARERIGDTTTLAALPQVANALANAQHLRFDRGFGTESLQSLDAVLRSLLERLAETYGYTDALLVSSQGDVVFALNNQLLAGINVYSGLFRSSELAKVIDRARAMMETEISDFQHVPLVNVPAAFVAAPVFSDGILQGAVALQIGNEPLFKIVGDESGLGATGETVIGIASGDELAYVSPLRYDPRSSLTRRVSLRDRGTPLNQAVHGVTGQGQSQDYRGEDVLAAWRYVPAMRWGMVVTVDAREALLPIVRQRNINLLLFFLTALLVGTAAWIIARRISTPIETLTRTIRAISAGSWQQEVPVNSRDEIGELSRAFNRMTADLKRSYESIEVQVRERTRELREEIRERQRIAQSLLQLSSAIEQSADSVLITARNGTIVYANPAFVQLTGYNADEFAGKNPRILKSGDHNPAFYEMLWDTILAGKSFLAEFTNRKKNGDLFIEEKTITPVIDADGSITHFVATGRDVTDRKRTEAMLAALNDRLIVSSRQAGMAEVATGVLHNVGNVLNSVNVSTTLVVDRLEKSRLPSLHRLTALLRERNGDLGAYLTSDPQGRQVPEFLAKLSENLADERKSVLGELELLRKYIDHIKDIVAMQQSYASVADVREFVVIGDLVDDSIRICDGTLSRSGIRLVREFASVPPITVEKHKVLQILVNVIRNAKIACEESDGADKRVIVRVDLNGERMRISISDNGVGIPPENLTRIFGHGFTTRKGGHGFGLHSSALAAQEMGGALTAQSDGPGLGATFILDLPINAETKLP